MKVGIVGSGFEDICFPLPRVAGAGGVLETLLPGLSEEELNALRHSTHLLRESARSIGY